MLKIRNFSDGDEVQIQKLFFETYQTELKSELWQWRFFGNPFGVSNIKLAFDENTLVGHYAVSPVEAIISNKKIVLAHSLTTMIHPEYQGRGLFSKMASELYENIKNDDYFAVWGFPNNNSYYGFVKNLNWSPIVDIPILSCKKAGQFTSQRLEIQKGFRGIVFEDYVDTTYNQLLKSDKYINWRYINHPVNNYECLQLKDKHSVVKGFVIFKIYNNCVDLVEVITKNDEFLFDILESIKWYFLINLKYECVNCWVNLYHKNYLSFLKSEFLPSNIRTYVGINCLGNNLQRMNECTDPRKWIISMGDSDVF